jgi:DNA-binding SARP family transcriptional activator/TolB-like protein
MYRLHMFGGLSLEGPTGPIGGRATKRRQLALLSLLAVAPPPGRSRESLMTLLWPEADEERGHALLADALYRLRKELGPDAVAGSGHELWLNRGRVEVDVAAFNEALSAGELELAAGHYSGPFLDGFHVSGMPEFERWVEAERRRLADTYGDTLERLARAAEGRGDLPQAIGWWRRAAAHDPYSSPVTLGLMEALAATGQHASALEAARTHERLLADDLKLEPAPEVAALVATLRENPPSVPSPSRRGPGVGGPSMTTPADLATAPPAPSAAPAEAPSAPPTPPPTEDTARRALRRSSIALAGIGGIVLVVVLGLLLPGHEASLLDPELIVVDAFANQTGDPALDPLGAMAGHWLVQSLNAAGLRVAPFDVLLTVDPGGDRRTAGPGRLQALARAGGARIVVSGSYYRDGERMRLQAEIADAELGEILYTPGPVDAPVDSPSLAFIPLRTDVRDFLYRYLRTSVVLDTIPGWAMPPDFEAYRRFLVGMDYFLDTHWAEAALHFEEAARRDPDYPAFRYMSAIALVNGGRLREAQPYLAGLDEVEGRMTPYDRATVAWLRAETPAEALRAARWMTKVGPSYVGYHVVALHSFELDRPEEALEILELSTVGPVLAPGWPPYWSLRSAILHALGRYEEELETATTGLALHPDAPVAFGLELPALAALDRCNEVVSAAEGLLRRHPTAHRAVLRASDELAAHDCVAAADTLRSRLARVLGARLRHPASDRSDGPRHTLIMVLERLDRDDEALALLEPLAAHDSLAYMEHLGILAARRGDVDRAEVALAWFDDKLSGFARRRGLPFQARIAAELGDQERAMEILRRATSENGDEGWVHRDYHLRGLRGSRAFRQRLDLLRSGG